jgi:hypothetical protein
MENPGSSSGESAEQKGRQTHTKGAAPKERIQSTHASVRRFVDQGGAAESLPCQQPDDSPGFIASYKEADENACLQILAFLRQYSLLSRGGLGPHAAHSGQETWRIAGYQPAVFFVLFPALPVLMTTFTASSIGSLKGTSIRSKPCS